MIQNHRRWLSGSGSGEFSDTRKRGSVAEQRNKAIACEWVVGLRTVNEDKGNAATTSECKF